ncbi:MULTISPECIES: DUF397 domain-containing protein [Thermomonospora]|uniref:DUF397 domain-containing protein n=1 Tax=Thermomonospora curvata (strain ATCC 19995 / DSM 43183 / JCM 3096 / KCTC 9072 / NBRC 15933 / NCIMB 10081 / Henssen B9) TaxID=471852 RepID=D1A2L9_THECD|nr:MULTISPECIES: DUF397 domain-containing protein [Thermomonospora]ACY96039.1 protein of unknown function DUF397 [Thermomonospora curvata DSM 43183]PKK15903.1 MAG: DUF397 domain-containing protein [Thermomonospora sp. CIF 1]
MTHFSQPQWRKSSRSAATGNDCVELADLGTAVGIRDSKNPNGPILQVSRHGLARMLEAARRSA